VRITVIRARLPRAGTFNAVRLDWSTLMGLDNPIHVAFLLIILLMVFGAKRLPEMGRSLGSGLRGFKESINGDSDPAGERTAAAAAPVTGEQVAEPTPIHPVA
jgi:sec-independent protein translocase protein TatA